MDYDVDFAGVHGPLDLGQAFPCPDEGDGHQRQPVFFGHLENAVLERKQFTVGAAVSFGENDDVVIVVNAVPDQLAHVRIFPGILVYGNAADTVQHPSKDGGFPEGGLCHEGGASDGGPENGNVQKTHVVCHDDKSPVLGNVFCSFYLDLDTEQPKDNILEIETTDIGDFVLAPAESTLVNNVGCAEDDHPGKNGQVEKNSANKSHKKSK